MTHVSHTFALLPVLLLVAAIADAAQGAGTKGTPDPKQALQEAQQAEAAARKAEEASKRASEAAKRAARAAKRAAAEAECERNQGIPAPPLTPLTTEGISSEDTRLVMGLEAAAFSSAARNWNYLLDFMLEAPLVTPKCVALVENRRATPPLTAWVNVRLTGVPQQNTPSVKQFVGGFETSLLTGSTNDITEALNFHAGLEFRTFGSGAPFGDGEYAFQPVFIIGLGFITTPAPANNPSVFEMSDQARERFVPEDDPNRSAYEHIAFVQPDRDHFYGQWYYGVRFKTHHFVSATDHRRKAFPGIIDVTMGQNAAISGGKLAGGMFKMLRVEAFYPIPLPKVDREALYFFGAAYLHFREAAERDTIILRAPTATVALPSPTVYAHTVTPDERKRDFWKFGVGL